MTNPVAKKQPQTFDEFMAGKKELLSKAQNTESPWAKFFVEFIPDVTAALQLPIIKHHPWAQTFLNNREGLTLIIIVSSVAMVQFTSLAAACTGGLFKITFIVIKLSSQGTVTMLTTSIFKQYYQLRKNHKETEIVDRMVRGMFAGLERQAELQLKFKAQVRELISGNANNNEKLLKVKAQMTQILEEENKRLQKSSSELKKEIEGLKGTRRELQEVTSDLQVQIRSLNSAVAAAANQLRSPASQHQVYQHHRDSNNTWQQRQQEVY